MKKIIVLLFLFCLQKSVAQLFGTGQLIDGQATTVKMVRTGDIDGDGDLDVVAAIFDTIVWYKNLDGFGMFGEQQVIGTGVVQAFSVYTAYINSDDYLDVLVSSFDNDKVIWYSNLDGEGNFGNENLISNNIDGIIVSIAADLDGDGDMDVITNSQNDQTLAWFENLDGEGNFGPRQIITNTATNSRSVFAGDLDGDGDIDIVSSDSGSITIAWFENLDGMGTFSTEHIIAPAAPAVEDVFGIDLDGDGDLDIISATNSEDKVAWHENLDGLGNFGPQQIITTNAGIPRSVYATDLDNDGDNDILSAGADFDNGKIAWYENLDGLGSFGPLQIIDTGSDGTRSVYAADLDGDGDKDVLGTFLVDYDIKWYENQTILGIEDTNEESTIKMYPNPVQNSLTIKTTSNAPISSIEVFDVLGKRILLEKSNRNRLNVSHLNKGIYFIKITTEKGTLTKKLVKK